MSNDSRTFTDGQHDLLRYDPRFRRESRVMPVNKFGRNPSITTLSDPETIWYQGGSFFFVDTPPVTHAISSDSAEDDAVTGTGAHTILVEGVDANWDPLSESIDLDGASAVNPTTDFLRVNRMTVTRCFAGTDTVPTGNITYDIAPWVAAYIAAEHGQTEQAIYSIPRFHTFYMSQYYASLIQGGGGSTAATVALCVNPQAYGDTDSNTKSRLFKHTQSVSTTGSSYFRHKFDPAFIIPGPADVWLEVLEVSGNTDISGGFDGYLIDGGVNEWP
jgi:hypothetical protein